MKKKKTPDYYPYLIFLIIIFIMLWLMPSHKIESIGDFFEKLIVPLSIPLSLIIFRLIGIDIFNKKD